MPFQAARRRLERALHAPGARAPRVAIVGGGLSGLAMAMQLERAGHHDYTIFEKNDGVGGTWRDNTYPGAACDVPSHLYSFSFERKVDWSRKFAEQPEILAYAESCADRHELRGHLRTSTEIASMAFDDAAGTWSLRTTTGETVEADVVVAACGQLNRPHVPPLPGLEDFAGTTFHSARWDHETSLEGLDVAVVGNGASAIQFVPHLARTARRLTVYQRSANYIVPKRDRPFSAAERSAFRRVPLVERLYRWSIYWRMESRWSFFHRGGRVARLVTALFAKGVRDNVVSERLPEHTVIPDYPLGCKRILVSSDYLPTLMRPNVEVVTSPITRIDTDAVVTADGTSRHADALLFATGFETTRFLAPIEVSGRCGRPLAETWAEGAEAHLGITVPGFPNLFLLYGPNTNLGHNSILFMVERQIDYVLQCLAELATGALGTVEVRDEAMSRFRRDIERRAAATAWAGSCTSWYKTATGRITNNWVGPTVAYWAATLRPRRDDFVPAPGAAGLGNGGDGGRVGGAMRDVAQRRT
ncbi:MAG TPA: NAD(P)/FAD-dependent oxidoreductase [Acidimicrobiales bacterium]|nr:NAD(P)/FAD-dependent oxidoreductase [Acidimicrobiales bacterium]